MLRSGSGRPRLTGVLLMGVLMMSIAALARAQVSPGLLARPHQDLDSNLKCFNCHGQRGQSGGSLPDRCLACHKEIAALIERGSGLHARIPKADCAKCHPEHAGRDFELVHWDEGSPERFDHARAGWPLQGKHATLKCRDCHKPAFHSQAVIGLAPASDHHRGWVGLERGCQPCHREQDVHRGALGKDCAKCHGQAAWKPATSFDHARTDFPLTGAHGRVACDKCHLAASLKLPADKEGNRVPLYKPLPHRECVSCHADPHAGRFGAACSKCHATDDWKRIGKERFNHDLTRYPLRGAHLAVRCDQCHVPKSAREKSPPFATCGTCHADPHAGRATLAGRAADCAACHTVQGFKPSIYTVEQHRSAPYPLEGKHAAVPCAACHRKIATGGGAGTAGVLIRMPHARCRDCHEDEHGGQLARLPDGGACEPCHRVEGWTPSTFPITRHATLRLPLLGRHARIACAACHGPERPGLPALPGPQVLGKARVAIAPRETECEACHADPHGGRFAGRRARGKPAGCTDCHGTESFRPSTVDVAAHAGYAFRLEGAHGAVPCDACHKGIKGARGGSSLLLLRGTAAPVTFAIKDQRCEACHQNPHGTQFASRPDRGACAACHSALAFRPAIRFDHDRDAGFRLEGAHARVACARCHATRKDATGRPMMVYRPVPKDCRSCHGKGVPVKGQVRS